MKFSCNTQEFLQALQLANRAISSQQALPILGNILFKAEGNMCTVSATDLELSIITSFPANIESEGSITIPAKAILNFAQYNTDPEVVLETSEGTQLKCTSAHSKTTLSGERASDYPSIPVVEKKSTFSLDGASLLEALNLVTFASARTSLRPVLSGVYLRTEGGKIVVVATDSYRLSEYTIASNVTEDISCIIPVKVLDELKVMLASKKPAKRTPTEEHEEQGKREEALPVHITLSAQQIEVVIGSTTLVSRLIEGKFPDYRAIIPKDFSTKSFISTKELTAAVKRMHYFAKEVNNNLTFTLKEGEADIATPQTQLGKDEATIPAEVSGGGKIALSSSYLLDFLGHIDSEQLELRMVDSQHPAMFYIPANDRFLHLIMPLRMQES
ncbi:MAG TPA: DNA polymerase III subunit beta [Candidatus Peribacteraceae bacterium]|nr:DNA polymerase III subunit beta [Candidatus Peribacteraceae bacterium]